MKVEEFFKSLMNNENSLLVSLEVTNTSMILNKDIILDLDRQYEIVMPPYSVCDNIILEKKIYIILLREVYFDKEKIISDLDKLRQLCRGDESISSTLLVSSNSVIRRLTQKHLEGSLLICS